MEVACFFAILQVVYFYQAFTARDKDYTHANIV